MSPKMSSLAIEEVPEQYLDLSDDLIQAPELHLVMSRQGSKNCVIAPIYSTADEVVTIGGKFTVSF